MCVQVSPVLPTVSFPSAQLLLPCWCFPLAFGCNICKEQDINATNLHGLLQYVHPSFVFKKMCNPKSFKIFFRESIFMKIILIVLTKVMLLIINYTMFYSLFNCFYSNFRLIREKHKHLVCKVHAKVMCMYLNDI